jgi:PBP1b-binding outer membrane lipoprotein LpoB
MTAVLSFYSVKTSSLDTRVENNGTFQSTKRSTNFKAENKNKNAQEKQKKCREKKKIGCYPL